MKKFAFILPLALALSIPFQANAALFGDDEARRSILDLREKKADKTAIIELANQNQLLREEINTLRGKIEELTNEVQSLKQKQNSFYDDLDARLGKFEPQQMTVDGKSGLVQPDERRLFDKSEAAFQAGTYKEAATYYNTFLKRYPKSVLAVIAQYGLGNAYYLQKDYKNALTAHSVVVKRYPESEKAPDAMLNMASSYIGMQDLASAKKTLSALVEKYPHSEAAADARDKLKKINE